MTLVALQELGTRLTDPRIHSIIAAEENAFRLYLAMDEETLAE